MLNVESYNDGNLLIQVPVWKIKHKSTVEINSLWLAEISGSWISSFFGVVEVKTKIILEILFCSHYRAVGREQPITPTEDGFFIEDDRGPTWRAEQAKPFPGTMLYR